MLQNIIKKNIKKNFSSDFAFRSVNAVRKYKFVNIVFFYFIYFINGIFMKLI